MLRESKILLDDQRCSNKNYIHHIRVHCIMRSSRFFYIAQCVVWAQQHKLLVTNKSEAMGIGRNLFSEKITQDVALDNVNCCQRHIWRVLGCSKGARQFFLLIIQTNKIFKKISLVEGTPCHNFSQRSTYQTVVWRPGDSGYSLASK